MGRVSFTCDVIYFLRSPWEIGWYDIARCSDACKSLVLAVNSRVLQTCSSVVITVCSCENRIFLKRTVTYVDSMLVRRLAKPRVISRRSVVTSFRSVVTCVVTSRRSVAISPRSAVPSFRTVLVRSCMACSRGLLLNSGILSNLAISFAALRRCWAT